jgi:hypothetical protein
VGDQVPFQSTSMIEVEFFDAFAGREPGGPDAVFAAVGVAGGDLALQTGRQVFLVGPRFAAARSASRPAESRRLGAFNARVR